MDACIACFLVTLKLLGIRFLFRLNFLPYHIDLPRLPVLCAFLRLID